MKGTKMQDISTQKRYCQMNFRQRLYYETAPLREEVKPAILFNIKAAKPCFSPLLKNFLEQSHLRSVTLFQSGIFRTEFIYHEQLLERQLAGSEVRHFLATATYERGQSTTQLLAHLQARYSLNRGHYPHEIGVFLGYPVEDVKGFMKYKGLNYKFSRYWKVYGNVQVAQKLFDEIDRAKTRATQQLHAFSEEALALAAV